MGNEKRQNNCIVISDDIEECIASIVKVLHNADLEQLKELEVFIKQYIL